MTQTVEGVGVGEDEERCSGPGPGPQGPQEWRIRGQPVPGPRREGRNGNGPEPRLDEMNPAQLFGRAVRFIRRGRRLTQTDLCARANISLGRLSAIENAEYRAWRRAADPIARALDFVDAADLLTRFYGNDLPVADALALLAESPDGDP